MWSLAGGFILIFGARLTGVVVQAVISRSGGIQMAFSSLVFAIFVFAGLIDNGQNILQKIK